MPKRLARNLTWCELCQTVKPNSAFARSHFNSRGLRRSRMPGVCRKCDTARARARRDRKYESDPYGAWLEKSYASHVRAAFDIRANGSELVKLAKKTTRCRICDCVLDWKGNRSNGNDRRPTLDRKNNESYISIDNVQIICRKCNRTKSDRTMSEFIEYCKNVANRFRIA